MNGKKLLIGLSNVSRKLIDESENDGITENTGTKDNSKKSRKTFRRPFLIAAIIAMMLLLVGCAVVYVLSIQNMKLGEQQEVYDIFSDDGSEYLGQETVTEQVLTLAGIKGTPGYQAALEWFEFKQNYDSDGVILASVWSNTPEFPAEYSRYGLYSQEMKDKVDEILGKYSLKPAGAILEFRTLKNMCAALGVERIQTASNDVSVLIESGECHENGNFSMMVDFTLPDSADAEITSTWGLLRWNRTDCFSDDMIALEAVDDWQEWNYTTVSGSEVLIIRSASDARGWIICDRGEAVLSLQLEARQDLYSDAGVEYRYLTDDQMELIADAIDFSIQPKVATQEDVNNQPVVPNASTQNGYTVELKSVETDGWIAYITMSITAPEGTIISHNPLEGFKDANYNIGPTNRQFLFPTEGNSTDGSGAWGSQEDNDGLDNTQDIVLKATRDMEDGSAPFGLGKVWTIRFEDLQASYWDREKNTNITQILVEGEWEFEITFDEENGDYREVELLQQPTVIDVVGLREPESPIWDGVNVTSFILRKFGATITFDAYYADFSEKDGQRMYVVMKDGSRILLYSHYGDCTPERTIDLDQVDYVLMVDGTKLMMPET